MFKLVKTKNILLFKSQFYTIVCPLQKVFSKTFTLHSIYRSTFIDAGYWKGELLKDLINLERLHLKFADE